MTTSVTDPRLVQHLIVRSNVRTCIENIAVRVRFVFSLRGDNDCRKSWFGVFFNLVGPLLGEVIGTNN